MGVCIEETSDSTESLCSEVMLEHVKSSRTMKHCKHISRSLPSTYRFQLSKIAPNIVATLTIENNRCNNYTIDYKNGYEYSVLVGVKVSKDSTTSSACKRAKYNMLLS